MKTCNSKHIAYSVPTWNTVAYNVKINIMFHLIFRPFLQQIF